MGEPRNIQEVWKRMSNGAVLKEACCEECLLKGRVWSCEGYEVKKSMGYMEECKVGKSI